MDVLAVWTNDGREYLVDKAIAGSAWDFPKFLVGTGGFNYVPDETQSALNTPIAVDQTDLTLTKPAFNVLRFYCHLPQISGLPDPSTISEIGVFTDTEILFCYGVFDPIAKTDSNEGWIQLLINF